MEILFWGLRDLKRVKKPQVIAECQGVELYSTVLANIGQNPNFTQPLQFLDLVYIFLSSSLFKILAYLSLPEFCNLILKCIMIDI